VSGSLFIGGNKSAYVKHPDGSHRALYCVESPESWFEDFGRGTLTNGKAEVKIDPDFASLVHADDYHVFLTGHDEHSEGLVVAQHRPDGFVVKERKGGASGGMFSYRVVARRKDVKGERLAKVELPPAVTAPAAIKVPELPKKP